MCIFIRVDVVVDMTFNKYLVLVKGCRSLSKINPRTAKSMSNEVKLAESEKISRLHAAHLDPSHDTRTLTRIRAISL